MRFQHELSYAEMARLSGVKSGTLHAQVKRALPVLCRCLKAKGLER
jgi:DNA-directed RNA polymerase specialized sigma24 family protein